MKPRNNIYNFIGCTEKTAIAVDCKNSNPYKLYQEELAKIGKIMFSDGSNTTTGYDWLFKFMQIIVEHKGS